MTVSHKSFDLLINERVVYHCSSEKLLTLVFIYHMKPLILLMTRSNIPIFKLLSSFRHLFIIMIYSFIYFRSCITSYLTFEHYFMFRLSIFPSTRMFLVQPSFKSFTLKKKHGLVVLTLTILKFIFYSVEMNIFAKNWYFHSILFSICSCCD